MCVMCVCVYMYIVSKRHKSCFTGLLHIYWPSVISGRQDGVVAANVTPKVRLTGFEFDFSSYQM